MEFYISPQSGQVYMINVLENQWLSVTYRKTGASENIALHVKFVEKWASISMVSTIYKEISYQLCILKAILMILGLF